MPSPGPLAQIPRHLRHSLRPSEDAVGQRPAPRPPQAALTRWHLPAGIAGPDLSRLDQDEGAAARGRALATDAGEYRVRWSIDVTADGAVDAARRARRIQLQPSSLAAVFEVLRHDNAVEALDWSLAETVDLTAHTRGHDQALDEIARVLRAAEWYGGDDMPYIAELVRLTGRDTVEPVTTDEEIDWR
jgi:hypothetical protein